MTERASKDVFLIVDEKGGKSRWTKVGAAFVNRDGSINAFLDALPSGGKIQIRDRKPKTNKEEGK